MAGGAGSISPLAIGADDFAALLDVELLEPAILEPERAVWPFGTPPIARIGVARSRCDMASAVVPPSFDDLRVP